MTTKRLDKVQEVFDLALEASAEKRSAVLAEACGDDAALRAEVESLLAHHERAPAEFMKPPEPDPNLRLPPEPDGPDPLIGQRVGQYRIERVLAAGGMGTVYLARQEHPERPVALKVMKAGIASRSALRRFEYESQILARLRHANIAHVYEAGTHQEESPGGRRVPYFVLEYIPEARTITGYAREQNLTARQRLELFAKVCDAVHHGHQKGIIHRDIKPGNILVDSAGEPKVIDFGVARSTDSDVAVTTMRTDVGQIIGTLQYMSPEQCDADPHNLDMRSDVYALGVVLYELLCDQLPYDVSRVAIYEATRVIREEPPARLSTIDRKLRGDVETIALKALEKDREQRYQSAADLARDIRRYLSREPIEAKPPTAWTRAVRWVARHPVVATGSACIGIGVIIMASTFMLVWFLNARPHKIELSDDGCEARLLSVGGRVLHSWKGETGRLWHPIRFAELVERPNELGGGRLAVLGFANIYAGPLGGSLCAFDVQRSLRTPLWARRVEESDILPQLLRRTDHRCGPDEFSAQPYVIVDIFPERPGLEIVVVFFHGAYSQRVIRIYDLAGELLYQVWHDGDTSGPYWMSDAGLLVFEGDNAMTNWDRRGNILSDSPNPRVVFAVRPKLGVIASGYLRTTPGRGPLSPEWYRRVLPENARDLRARFRLRSPGPLFDPGRFVRLDIQVDPRIGAGVNWVINEYGEEVPGSRIVSDAYKRDEKSARPKLPDPDAFKLGPMPPMVEGEAPESGRSKGESGKLKN